MTREPRYVSGKELGKRLSEIYWLKDARKVDKLLELLSDQTEADSSPTLTVRAAAARALGQLGEPKAAQPIAVLLTDRNPHVRVLAAQALGNVPDRAVVPALVQALHDPEIYVQAQSAKSLGAIGDRVAVAPLTELLLSTRHWWVRRTAADALAQIGDPAAIDFIKQARAIERFDRRRHISKALRSLKRRRGAKGSG